MCPVKDKLIAGLENSDTGTGMKKVAKLQVHVHRYTCTNKQHICNQLQKYMLTHITIFCYQGMLSSVLLKLDQSSERAKTSRHKMTGMLAKDFIAVRTAIVTSMDKMRTAQVEQTKYGRTDQEGLRHNRICLQMLYVGD